MKLTLDKQLDFLSIATHEIKAPLTIIRGDVEIMLKSYADLLKNDKLRVLISEIQSEVLRSISITHDFLNIARLEEGKIKFTKQIFSLPKLAEDVIKEFSTMAKIKNIYLKLDPPNPNLPKAKADPDGVKHILFNLIDNAMKFTQKGGVTVSIDAQAEFLKVRVTDTGPGVPQEKVAHLFEKFMQEDGPKESSGLGLYIAKLFAENMGGKIQLEKTQTNTGSVFLFTVPVEKPTSGSIIVTLEN